MRAGLITACPLSSVRKKLVLGFLKPIDSFAGGLLGRIKVALRRLLQLASIEPMRKSIDVDGVPVPRNARPENAVLVIARVGVAPRLKRVPTAREDVGISARRLGDEEISKALFGI